MANRKIIDLPDLAPSDAGATDNRLEAWVPALGVGSRSKAIKFEVLNGALDRLKGSFNVKDPNYGAVGDGATDDRVAIQAAITAALSAGSGTVYFPRGTYYLNSYGSAVSGTAILAADGGSGTAKTIAFIGAPGAVITTPLNTNTNGVETITLYLTGNLEDCLVEGLDFRNTHGVTAGRTIAVYADGGSSNTVKRLTLQRNIFRNFARTLPMSGVEGLSVLNNRFLYTNGRDSGNTNLADPNVALWCFVQTNGQTSDVRVIGNYFDGCTSGDVSSNTNKFGLDGFVYGAARRWYISGNEIRHNGVEAIYISHRENSAADVGVEYPSIITANVIDCSLPNTGALEQTYGIRTDEQATLIGFNTIYYAMQGILATGSGLTNALDGVQIMGNTLVMPVTPKLTGYGIQVNTCNAPSVRSNLVYWNGQPATGGSERMGIQTFATNNARIAGNVVRATALPASGTLHGVYLQQTHSSRVEDHTSKFCTNAFYEHQHPSGQPGNRIKKLTATSCTNGITGDDINELYVEEHVDKISADKGDANYTVLSGDPESILFATALTANRTVTLTNVAATAAVTGRRYKIVRTGLGAFTLTVQTSTPTTLKVIPNSTAAVVEVMIDATGNWRLVGYQTL